jgi:hypothetical protein
MLHLLTMLPTRRCPADWGANQCLCPAASGIAFVVSFTPENVHLGSERPGINRVSSRSTLSKTQVALNAALRQQFSLFRFQVTVDLRLILSVSALKYGGQKFRDPHSQRRGGSEVIAQVGLSKKQ